jgi:drug/metabolite transporter (DMT)-like permease
MSPRGDRRWLTLVLVCFAVIWFVWGSTFLAIRIAIADLPPVLMCGLRLLLAGALLLAWAALTRAPLPSPREARHAALVGLMLPAAGNGSVTVSELHVPSGIVALLVATIPLWMALLASFGPHAMPPAGRARLGLVLGFGGILLLIGPGLLDAARAEFSPWWALLPVAGSLSWAWGSLWSRRVALPVSPVASTGIGLAAGGVVLLALAVPSGDWARFEPAAVGAAAWAALLYLAVAGSVLGYSAYLFLLREVAPGKVATYAFINPVVAMALGWAFAGEALSPRTLQAAVIVVVAVALITTARAPARAAVAAPGRAVVTE